MSNHVPPPYESVDDILRELEAIDEERLYYYKDRERLKQVVARQEREIERLKGEHKEVLSKVFDAWDRVDRAQRGLP